MAFMMNRRAGLFHCGYTILGGFVEPMFSTKLIWKAAGMKEGFLKMETSVLRKLVSLKFPGDTALKRGHKRFGRH